MARMPLTPDPHETRRASITRIVLVTALISTAGGCTSLATREDEYRQRKVALDPLARDDASAMAGVEVGPE